MDPGLLAKVKKLHRSDRVVIKTWSRSSTIYPEMVGFRFGVHNGREHIPVTVTEDMVGHKLGEFSLTRKFVKHGGRLQREAEAALQVKEGAAGGASEDNKK